MKKIIFLLLLLGIVTLFIYHPIVIDLTEDIHYNQPPYSFDESINPIAQYNFGKNSKVYIHLEQTDKILVPNEIENASVLICEDENILKEFQKQFIFKPTRGDIATVESWIYVYQKGKLIFKSAIILDKNSIGLQNREMGCAEIEKREEFIKAISRFERSYFPIHLLKN